MPVDLLARRAWCDLMAADASRESFAAAVAALSAAERR
jgi:hypothetical protein